jgi:hypothetical protein
MIRRKPRNKVEVVRDGVVYSCAVEDDGIGNYEFHGRKGYDSHYAAQVESARLPDGTTIDIDDISEGVLEAVCEEAMEAANEHPENDYEPAD